MTVRIPILNQSLAFDVGVFPSKLSEELTLTNPKEQICTVMPFPTGADLGFELNIDIPQNYSADPAIVFKGVIDGTPANVMAFYVQQLSRADSESVDTAYEAEDLANNSVWTGYADEDMFEIVLALTPAAPYVPGDTNFLRAGRDDSVDDTTFNFLQTDLLFQYTET